MVGLPIDFFFPLVCLFVSTTEIMSHFVSLLRSEGGAFSFLFLVYVPDNLFPCSGREKMHKHTERIHFN